jgi:hypothetical protein
MTATENSGWRPIGRLSPLDAEGAPDGLGERRNRNAAQGGQPVHPLRRSSAAASALWREGEGAGSADTISRSPFVRGQMNPHRRLAHGRRPC